jgi:hypothetical protein
MDKTIVGQKHLVESLLIALPHGGILGGVYLADGVKLVLQLAVAGECAVYIVGIIGQRYYLGYDGVFAFKVGGAQGFLGGSPLGLLGAKALYCLGKAHGGFVGFECFFGLATFCGIFCGRFMEHAEPLAQTPYVIG